MAYPNEFKQKALELVEHLNSINQASKALNIAYTTLRKWVELWNNGEDLSHNSGGKRFEKINLTELEEYIKQNPDKFLYEIAEEFHCSASGIAKALKKLGYTNKKNDELQRTKRTTGRRVQEKTCTI